MPMVFVLPVVEAPVRAGAYPMTGSWGLGAKMSTGALVPSPPSAGASCSSELYSTPKLDA